MSDLHRPELECREGLLIQTETRLTEEDRPRGLELDLDRGDRGRAARSDEQEQAGADDIDESLRRCRDVLEQTGRQEPSAGESFDRGAMSPAADELVEPRHDVDDHLSSRSERTSSIVARVGSPENATITRSIAYR